MEYVEVNFRIQLSDNTLIFSGALEKTVYTEVADFLRQAEERVASDDIILDFRSLEFLNSTGIRMLAVFLTGSAKNFYLLRNTTISWQKNALAAIRQIKPSSIHLSEN